MKKRRNMTKNEERIKKALNVIVGYGSIDGDHHKAWVLDQAVRELTGCPTVEKTAISSSGKPYTYDSLGESDEYKKLTKEACDGEDGPDTYEWDEGIAP